MSESQELLVGAVAEFEVAVLELAQRIARQILDEEYERRLAELPPPAAEPEAAPEPAPTAPLVGLPHMETPATRGRGRWTRETIIHELSNWLLSGSSVEASFVSRHGPKGLVSSARRIFGRFDAALNHANLHLSHLYPDGPPSKKRG